MRERSSGGEPHLHLPSAFPLMFLALVVCSGCSRSPMPLAPKTESHVARPSSVSAGTDVGPKVVVTLAPDADPGFLVGEGFSVLAGQVAWRVAAIAPAPGETADELVARLAADGRIQTAEVDATFETAEAQQQAYAFDDGYGSPVTLAIQHATIALGIGEAHLHSTGSGVRVAILDTGAELTHPALAGRIVAGYDFVDNDDDPSDVGNGIDDDGDGVVDEALGHGTHVAGIVSIVAPDAQLLIGRVLDDDGRGDMVTVARAIRWAYASGARVINLSLGGLQRSAAVELALAEAAEGGALCVCAAGNRGGPMPQEYPATSGFAWAVAALDEGGAPAPFTSYGSFVDVSAPGDMIRSAYVHGGYALWSGTSMSTAFVSGTAALLAALHPQWGPGSLMARLQVSADPISTSDQSFLANMGSGALNVARAVEDDNEPTRHHFP